MNINNDLIKIETINDITYIKFKKLEEYCNIEHAFYIGKKLDFKTRDINKNNIKDNYKNYETFLNLFKKTHFSLLSLFYGF